MASFTERFGGAFGQRITSSVESGTLLDESSCVEQLWLTDSRIISALKKKVLKLRYQ